MAYCYQPAPTRTNKTPYLDMKLLMGDVPFMLAVLPLHPARDSSGSPERAWCTYVLALPPDAREDYSA